MPHYDSYGQYISRGVGQAFPPARWTNADYASSLVRYLGKVRSDMIEAMTDYSSRDPLLTTPEKLQREADAAERLTTIYPEYFPPADQPDIMKLAVEYSQPGYNPTDVDIMNLLTLCYMHPRIVGGYPLFTGNYDLPSPMQFMDMRNEMQTVTWKEGVDYKEYLPPYTLRPKYEDG